MGKFSDDLLGGQVQQQGAGRFSDELLGGGTQMPTQQAAQEPPKEGLGRWLVNSIAGRQDPREADTGTVYEQFTDDLRSPTASAAMLGASDEQMGDIISKNLGDRVLRRERDANGYEVLVTRGPNGQEQRGYVNAPGLDTQDLWRGAYSVPLMAAGGGAAAKLTKGAGAGLKMIGQAVGLGGASVAGDVAQMPMGSEQGVEIGKAGVTAGLGAASIPISAAAGALWRRFAVVPGLIDKNTGQLTARGIEAAKKAGIDPRDMPPDFAEGFAKTFSQTNDPAEAAIRYGTERYNIPATQGQVTKDPYLLTQEEGMRRRLFGEGAQVTMQDFDRTQARALESAALGSSGAKKPSIGEMVAPHRSAMNYDRAPSVLGENVQETLQGARQTARAAENEAWKGATGLEVTDQALATLPDALNKSLGGLIINDGVTPVAGQMAREIERILTGEAPQAAAAWIKNTPSKNVDQMRRSLLAMYKGADKPADKDAAKAIYDGFNEWISESAKASLLKGDPEAAMKLVKARGFTKEVRDLFSPTASDGKASPAGRRLASVLDSEKADSGEAVVQALFGSQGSRGINNGTVGALNNIKTVLDRFAPEEGRRAWDDIRLAYWSRLVTNKGGELVGPRAMVSNIKAALQGQDSVMKTLYSPKEVVEITTFMRAVERIAYKPPNASGSGYTAASFARDAVLKLLDSFGLGTPARAALNYTGVGNAWNAAAARKAVSQSVRPNNPNTAPYVAATGRPMEDQSGSR